MLKQAHSSSDSAVVLAHPVDLLLKREVATDKSEKNRLSEIITLKKRINERNSMVNLKVFAELSLALNEINRASNPPFF